jgi:hypothetical protein
MSRAVRNLFDTWHVPLLVNDDDRDSKARTVPVGSSCARLAVLDKVLLVTVAVVKFVGTDVGCIVIDSYAMRQ